MALHGHWSRLAILAAMSRGELSAAGRAASLRHPLSKVPEVTVYFWITKVLTTGMGETTSDYLVRRFDPPLVVALAGCALVVVLVAQLRARRYIPWLYWLAVVMVSVFGTMIADVLHVQFQVPYLVSTVAFMLALAAIFVLWYCTERSLSIHDIRTRRREVFYWATVITTFALGTATGDMTAMTLQIGFLASGILFAVLIALPGLALRLQWLGATAAFWTAYVLTRPLGASFSDWAALPPSRGGLGTGTGPVSLALAVVIVLLVAGLSLTARSRSAVESAASSTPSGLAAGGSNAMSGTEA